MSQKLLIQNYAKKLIPNHAKNLKNVSKNF